MIAATLFSAALPGLWTGILLLVLPGLANLPASRRRSEAMQQFTSTAIRLGLYRQGQFQLWGIAALTLLVSQLSGFALVRLQLAPGAGGWLLDSATGRALAWTLVGVGLTVHSIVVLHCSLYPAARRQASAWLRDYRWFLPVTAVERRTWMAMSVTAGICEELSFRGFLLNALCGTAAAGPHLGALTGILLSSAAFGLMHAYQGVGRIWLPALAGLLLSLLALLTGSVWLPMLVHAWVDLADLLIYQPERDAPEHAAALRAGCAGPGALY